MTIQERKSHFIKVGKFLGQFRIKGIEKDDCLVNNDPFYSQLEEAINNAVHHNGWFTTENVLFSLEQWSKALTANNLDKWLDLYSFQSENLKSVAIIMAGNIPLVGFHDFISVILSGNKVIAKQSSNDNKILPIIANYLIALEPEYKNRIFFTEDRLPQFDAVIATGSNNTSRYFEYYFAEKPSIIRNNRNSVAVLTGKESEEELKQLGEDIFRYFGLGCRNVSKIYIPQEYEVDQFFEALFPWKDLINNAKFANNYDYNKAVYLMSEFKLRDNGFLILKEDESFSSPIATLFYEKYEDIDKLRGRLNDRMDEIQCIVSNNFIENETGFGQTQQPQLWDYADNVDTIAFLNNL